MKALYLCTNEQFVKHYALMILGGGEDTELSVALKNPIPKQNRISVFWLVGFKLIDYAAALLLY